MNTRQTLLKHVTIRMLKEYLMNKGWLEEPFGRDMVLKFAAPPKFEFDGYYVLIPSKPELFDYDHVVGIAIDLISVFEDRSFDDALFDILPRALVELIELRDLILGCERLISRHGDDFALAQALESLKARERNINMKAEAGLLDMSGGD